MQCGRTFERYVDTGTRNVCAMEGLVHSRCKSCAEFPGAGGRSVMDSRMRVVDKQRRRHRETACAPLREMSEETFVDH